MRGGENAMSSTTTAGIVSGVGCGYAACRSITDGNKGAV